VSSRDPRLVYVHGEQHPRVPCGDTPRETLHAFLEHLGIPRDEFYAEFPPADRCLECGADNGNIHRDECLAELCPVDGRPLEACLYEEDDDSFELAIERLADVLYWIGVVDLATRVPRDDLLAFVQQVIVRRLEWLPRTHFREASSVPENPFPEARPSYCHRCDRGGGLKSCDRCTRMFHWPQCDGFPHGDSLLCSHCYLQPMTDYRVAMRCLANALGAVALAHSLGESPTGEQ
jgi:hypothetical protein